MRNLRSLIFLVFVSAITVCGCGGGGGGGSSGSSGGGSQAKTGVRILHGALDVSPLDLYVSGNPDVLQSVRFSAESRYAGVAEGGQILNITRALTPGSNVFSIPVTVAKGQRQSVLVYGDTAELGVRQVVINDDPGEIPEGSAALRVVHSVVGAAAISASTGGVEISSGTAFGSASGYAYLAAGPATFAIRRVVDGREIASTSLVLEEGRAYSVLVAGEIDYLVVTPTFEDR